MGFADAAGDQLRVLGAEVQDQDSLVCGPHRIWSRLGFNLGPVVGGFLGDDHVVDVALPQTGLGDLNEARPLLHLDDGRNEGQKRSEYE